MPSRQATRWCPRAQAMDAPKKGQTERLLSQSPRTCPAPTLGLTKRERNRPTTPGILESKTREFQNNVPQDGKYEVHLPPVCFLCPWQTSLVHPSIVVLRTVCFFNNALWAGHYQVIGTGKQDNLLASPSISRTRSVGPG